MNLWWLQIVKTFGLVDDDHFHAITSITGFSVVDNSAKHALNITITKRNMHVTPQVSYCPTTGEMSRLQYEL